MSVLDEPPTLLDPLEVDLLRKIVLEEDCDDQKEAGHKGETREIVNVLCCLRDAREGVRADQRQQQQLPEGDVKAGQAENDKGYRGEPMRETLEGPEAGDLNA